ncbi:MAG TPA: carbohydrate ABC transporter permease, partial [Pseudonocardiaceae bacterium]|nr:carbohydrate ABC transporter permease [Pseudonocardiaceae bacterium]
MAAIDTTGRKTGWALLDLLVILYALIPVLWIASLSFKPTSSVTDGSFIPRQWTLDNYRGIF